MNTTVAHAVTFFCAHNPTKPWTAHCVCGAIWTDPEYTAVEHQWVHHSRHLRGVDS